MIERSSYLVQLTCSIERNKSANANDNTVNEVTASPGLSNITTSLAIVIYRDAAYTREAKAAETVKLGEPIYVRVSYPPMVSDIDVILYNCWATQNVARDSIPKVDLIVDRFVFNLFDKLSLIGFESENL